ARRRKHPSLPPAPQRPIYVEHEYARTGACAYIAAWDVHRAKLFGRCERKTGIVPFDRLVAQVMREEPVAGCEDPRIDGVRRNGDEISTAVGSMLFAGKEKRGGMGEPVLRSL